MVISMVTPVEAAGADIASLYVEATQYYAESFKVLDLVNKERTEIGLSELKMDRDLLTATMQRSAELAIYFSHTRPSGEHWRTVSNKAWGENIAAGSSTAAGVMNQWMNSSGHKANILNTRWNSIGIGLVVVDGVPYWTQLFGENEIAVASAGSYSDKTVEAKVDTDLNLYYLPSIDFYPSGNLTVGNTKTLRLYCKNSTNFSGLVLPKSLTFESSNTSIATVDAQGNVSALKAGNVTISAYPKGKSSKKVQLEMTIEPNTSAPTPIPQATATPRPTATATPRPTATATPRPTATATPRPTATVTPRPTATATPRPQPVQSFTIRYNANGGSKAPNAQTKVRGKGLTLSTAKPTRTGYRFEGWAESAKATRVQYKPGAQFTSEKNTTLYAVWTANKYTIAYNKNGGKGKISNTKATYAKTVRLRTNTIKRNGHKFNGWTVYRKSDKKWLYVKGSKTEWYRKNKQPAGYKLKVYKNKAKVNNLTTKANDRVTMYAQWKKR